MRRNRLSMMCAAALLALAANGVGSALATQIDDRLSEIMADGRLSLTQALVLVSLDLANNVQKQAELTEKYKSEIADYLNDAANAMSERDKYKRELDKLKSKQA